MKTIVLVALLLAASAVQAQVYKCKEGGKIVYTQIPCEAWEPEMDLKVHQPTEEDRRRAEAGVQANQAIVRAAEKEREAARHKAEAAVQAEQVRAAAMKKKCDGYRAEISRLEGQLAKKSNDYNARARQLQEKLRTECR